MKKLLLILRFITSLKGSKAEESLNFEESVCLCVQLRMCFYTSLGLCVCVCDSVGGCVCGCKCRFGCVWVCWCVCSQEKEIVHRRKSMWASYLGETELLGIDM